MAKRRQGVLTQIGRQPVLFSGAFVVFFLLSWGFLYLAGATPNPLTATDTQNGTPQPSNTVADVSEPEYPVRIVAKDINLDVAIVNPDASDNDTMDNALTEGAARWPTSGLLGVNGTVALFGHSSYLPVVYHSYYKTFDGIQNLKPGAIVSVYSGTTEYRYAVSGVQVLDSTVDQVPLPTDAKYLTLITCNSFAAKEKRFVVSATYVGAYALTQ